METEAKTNGYDGNLITSKTFLKRGAILSI